MMQVQLVVLLLLLGISALCSLSETALTGMSRIKIIAYIRNKHKAAKALQVWMKDPNKLIATILIVNNIVAISASTLGAFLSMRIAEAFGLNPVGTATGVAATITVIVIIFGEITPKVFAIHRTEKLGLAVVGPVVLIYTMIRPLTTVFVKISNFIVKLFGGKPLPGIPVVSAKDITTVIDAGAEEGHLGEQQKSMMANILEFKDLQVKHIMVPRTSMTAVAIDWNVEKIIDIAMETGFSRMPVYKDHFDHIIGIIYTKDMLTMIKNRGLLVIQDLVRIPTFVPETKAVSELLTEFKKGRFHMAIVVDEFGGTAGLVTIEDILEEIVGEIQDEYDMEDRGIDKVDEDTFNVKARCEIDKVNEICKVDLPEEDDINTIGGFVSAVAGSVPKEGAEVKFGNIKFTILKSDVRKINRLKLEIARDKGEGRGEKEKDSKTQ